MIKQNVESLLDAEMVQAMKKRPGMFIGSLNYKGIIRLCGYIFKAVLRNRSEPLFIEWVIKEDENFSIQITGNTLNRLKEKLNHFIHIDLLEGFDKHPYYMFFLFMERIEILLVCEGEQICVKKEHNTLVYDSQCTDENDKCFMDFVPDRAIFKNYVFSYDPVMEYVKLYAYQYPNLTIKVKDDRELKQLNTYHFTNGLKDKLDALILLNFEPDSYLWEVRYSCTIDGCHINLYFCIIDHIYIHPPYEIIYAEDDNILSDDYAIKAAVIKAMKESMEKFSQMNHMELVFREAQLSYLTNFAANIYGSKLIYGGQRRTRLEMPELTDSLRDYMKLYFDQLFVSDKKYIKIIDRIGVKKDNTQVFDVIFPPE